MAGIQIACKGSRGVPYTDLQPFQGELKSLSDVNYKKLKRQILELGFSSPIHVWVNENRNCILDGHQRLETLKRMANEGYDIPTIPVVDVHVEGYAQAKRKVLALTSQFGEMTFDSLAEFAADMDISTSGLAEAFRFPEVEFPEIESPGGLTDEDAAPENVPSICQPGQLWKLGQHRLLCGDCTDKANVERLMGGEKADMVFTDPPYGVSERTNRASSGRGKRAEGLDFQPVIGDDSTDTAVAAFNLLSDVQGIWFGANYYASSIPNTSSWLVWDKREGVASDDNADCELAWVWNEKPARIFRHLWRGCIRKSEKQERRVHPTQKPIALAEWCFENYGNPKKVLDVFLGSGSTLIACEKTGRKCYGMEIEPHYCDVIIKRWEDFTGHKAELIEDVPDWME